MKKPFIRTLKQARAHVLKVGICGIFSDAKGTMSCLWDVVDLPGRQKGEKGWGQKVTSIWGWKNELPALYPDEIFYGKIPGGLAVLMSMKYLRETHYPSTHKPVESCSPVAQRLYRALKFDPYTTSDLRKELGMTQRPERSQFERGLQELQVTLNIARRNSLEDENDTWVLFREQYLDLIRDKS